MRAASGLDGWSKEGVVDTTKLRRVVSVKARLETPLEEYGGATWVSLPQRLAAGWYLVQLPGDTRPRQAVLQVTDVAGYLLVSETRTLVWANDLKSGRPVKGATIAAGTSVIGTTDANGLATGTTPKGLLPSRQRTGACSDPCDPVVTVRTADGRAIFLPATSDHDKR